MDIDCNQREDNIIACEKYNIVHYLLDGPEIWTGENKINSDIIFYSSKKFTKKLTSSVFSGNSFQQLSQNLKFFSCHFVRFIHGRFQKNIYV